MKGAGDKTRLAKNEPRGSRPVLEKRSIDQLKCIYTNARSMGDKQEELEAIAHQETVMWSPSRKHGGMTHTIGALQWMATSSLEGTGEEGEVMG